MTASGEFSGLRAVVTGGASGIGLATAVMLADRGARVASLDIEADVPAPIVGLHCDVTDDDSVRNAVGEAIDRFGGLDIVVNNAGIGAQGTVADNADAEWLRCYDVNVLGIVRTTRASLDALRRSPSAADRQHLLDRGDGGTARAGLLLGDQGCRHGVDHGDGR